MERAKIVKIIHIPLYQKQADVVERIQEKESLSGKIRELISAYGDEKYPETPAYAEAMKTRADLKKKEVESKLALENMSPEDYCSGVLGGKVSADGASCCFIFMNTNMRRVPLGEIKEWRADDGIPADHRAIVGKTKTDINGRLIDDSNWKLCMEALDKA